MAQIKGIVMESQNGQAVIMTPQGEFKRIKINKPVETGETYTGTSMALWKFGVAAVIILTLSLGTVDFFSVKAYAQISPSVEIGINRWHIVVSTHALDATGEEIVGQSQLIGRRVDVATERIVDQSFQNGTLEEETLPQQFQVQSTRTGQDDDVFIQRVEDNVKEGVKKSIDKKKAKSVKQDQSQDQAQDQPKNQGQDQNQDQGKVKETGRDKNSKDQD